MSEDEKPEPLTPAQLALVESAYPWCWKLANRFVKYCIKRHFAQDGYEETRLELFQAAVLRACDAAKRFDPSRGRTFLTYAASWCLRGVQEQMKHYSPISPSFTHCDGTLKPIRHRVQVIDGDLIDVPAPEPRNDGPRLADIPWKQLTRRQRRYLVDYYLRGIPARDIATREGLDKRAVLHYLAKARQTAREAATV